MLISFQIAGIVIIFIIVSFFLAQTRLALKSGKVFLLVCFTTFLLLFLDIFSITCIVSPDIFNINFTKFISKLYLVFLVFVASFGLVYVMKDVYKFDKKKRRIFYYIHMIYLVSGSIPLLLTDINLVYNPTEHFLYTEGPSCLICYVLCGLLLITTIVTTIIYKDKINKANRDTIVVWMSFWIIAAIIQFFVKELLVVSFASCAGLIIIYINLENPALTIDKKTSKFNFELLEECITELSDKNYKYKIVFILLQSNSLDVNLKNNALISYSNALSHFTNTKISMYRNHFLTFRSDLGFVNILMNSTSEEFFLELEKELKNNHYYETYGDLYDIKYLIFEDNSIISNYEKLRTLFDSILEKNLIAINNKKNYITASSVEKINKTKEMEEIVNYAIDHDLVEVFYQPIYSKESKSFTSAEALVRIRDKDGKIIFPGDFIEIAERNGSILKLGEAVFIHVCQFIHNNNIDEIGLHYIEVNLSVIQCGDPNLAERYIDIMKQYNINPKYINLEITETASTSLKNIMLDNMNKLINYGVSFSLDDFGMGNSNLNYIIEMPVQIVKFDRILVNQYFNDPKARLVVDKIIEMIKALNLDIVLEGIEDEEIVEQALNMDIDYIQGYYFSQPIMKKPFLNFIKEHNIK